MTDNITALQALSPIDGRYASQTEALKDYFSEAALIKYRVRVEIEYFIALSQTGLPEFAQFNRKTAQPVGTGVNNPQSTKCTEQLRAIYENFTIEDAAVVKAIEKRTNHDVKAVEYFIKEKFDSMGLQEYKEFIHFGLTSQDINNTAIPLALKEMCQAVYCSKIEALLEKIDELSAEWADVPMLAHTHGQPAVPTKVGKELAVFSVRIKEQLRQFKAVPFCAKFGGAVGNMNAHFCAYPQVGWNEFAQKFIESLGLTRSYPTTQIEHYDNLAALFDAAKRINTIIIDLCRDMWSYISMEYFNQKVVATEVGSSAMPQKVNPIDFENAEGNAGLANAIFAFLAGKLPVSRLQRDLTDSTVLRNITVPFGHTIVAINSTVKGLGKLILNREKLDSDLNANWAIVSEGIQTVLRRIGYPQPYEALKALTRGKKALCQEDLASFIESLDVSADVKEELLAITPFSYTGITASAVPSAVPSAAASSKE